uniref:Solute carrier family 46 member 3 n=2 Tax=Parascaris univalens TaxID=6257 RepID=A0A914ZSB8_PARUN
MGESDTSEETDLGVVLPTFKLEIDERKRKPVLHPSDRVAIPLCVYSITASMFHPVFQSLVYQKVCEQSETHLGILVNCTDRKSAATNQILQTEANTIILLCSVAMSLLGGISSALLGRLGDAKSRKMALLVPFGGLILADCTLILQSFFSYLSAHWLILSEALFAICGGYMSIISSCFAYASDAVSSSPNKSRSRTVAILEGTLGLGGTIGFLCAPLLPLVGFTTVFTAFSFLHLFCILCFFLLPDIKHRSDGGLPRSKRTFCGCRTFNSLKKTKQKSHLAILVLSFGISFLAFIGSTHILFYYLKFRFNWDAALFGLLKGPLQGISTLATLFLYPWLRSRHVADCSLTLVGIVSRLLGRLWIGIAWNTASVFLLIVLDAFSRFAATGLRAMMANSVMPEDHGSLFALIAITEACCNLIAAIVFHMLFPVSIPILPQISFVILASILLIPLWLIWSRWDDLSMIVDQQSQDTELKTIEIGEDPERLQN